ncbi:Bug family tripartite tricarboxylate transporter substrate binding protein [Cupriavidus plantarum]|uniref:Bug family tripartite tricarboxylate transporter substrate binding protein n=1 Tax=Cupriavidus plantarum TaxID=942865 RepID=UPI000E25F02E|nr:tripartite tricarboxylate transporter substrate binding protein [Cupriavidus plantarum]REE92215.1 tripartite-type tricarboxylate transporter receptor subunit TctC [Cupriavidus plantarum]
MQPSRRRFVRQALGGSFAAAFALPLTRLAHAQAALGAAAHALPANAAGTLPDGWPAQPIKVVVPFPPGGSTDILGRFVAEHLQRMLGKPVMVENLPGATGTIGVASVARANPDGYTLLMGSVGTMVTNHFAYDKLPFTMDSIAPVINLAETPNVLMVRPSLDVGSPAALIALMKAKGGSFHYGSSGVASSAQISCEVFKQRAGVQAVHVPYKGGSQMLTDLIAGNIDFTIDQISSALKLIQARRVRALAVTSAKRSPLLPDLPTLSETMPGFVMSPWFCVGAPANTPGPVVSRLNALLNDMLADKAIVAKMEAYGIVPVGGTPGDLAALIRRESAQMQELSTRVQFKTA